MFLELNEKSKLKTFPYHRLRVLKRYSGGLIINKRKINSGRY